MCRGYHQKLYPLEFRLYAACVELARRLSQGSGELNKFDHLAKDFHEDGFNEMLDEIPKWRINAFCNSLGDSLTELANQRYANC